MKKMTLFKYFGLIFTFLIITITASSQENNINVSYPRILIHNFKAETYPLSEEQIIAMAKRDLIVLGPIIMRKDIAAVKKIKSLNPKIRILLYSMVQAVHNKSDWMLADPDEATIFAPYGESWSVSAPDAELKEVIDSKSRQIEVKSSQLLERFQYIFSEKKKRNKNIIKPVILIDNELMRVNNIDGQRLFVTRGVCESVTTSHQEGSRIHRVHQPSWAGGIQRNFSDGELLYLNMSDNAAFIGGRRPWQIKADHLIDAYWDNIEWRALFDGFFFDTGNATNGVIRDLDINHDGLVDVETRQHLIAGIDAFCKYLRKRGGNDLIFVLNNTEVIFPEANGRHREHYGDGFAGDEKLDIFRSFAQGQFAFFQEPFKAWIDLGSKPLIYLNTSQPGTINNFQQLRFSLASSLMLGGYFQYRATSGDSGNWKHWYDEFSVDNFGKASSGDIGRNWLGHPLSSAELWSQDLKTPNLLKNNLDNTNIAAKKNFNIKIEEPIEKNEIYTLTGNFQTNTPGLVSFEISENSSKQKIYIYVTSERQTHTMSYVFRGKDMSKYTISFDTHQLRSRLKINNLSWQRGNKIIGWYRKFENGIAVVNSSPTPQIFKEANGYSRILGTQDPQHNNGQIVDSILEIAPWDAYLLIRK